MYLQYFKNCLPDFHVYMYHHMVFHIQFLGLCYQYLLYLDMCLVEENNVAGCGYVIVY